MALVNYALLNKIFLIVFVIITVTFIYMSLALKMQTIAFILLLANFVVAFLVAIFGSLRIRSEEEEKMLK